MDVVARFKGFDQARVLGEVGYAAKFNLVVIGYQQFVPRRGHKRGSEHPAPIRANGNVVQVGGVGTETAGASHGLVETALIRSPGPISGDKPFAVCGA